MNETKCMECHIVVRDVKESHGNLVGGPNYADCTQCHFPNTTQKFNFNNSLFVHSHNMTVEYNFYNYSISGIPLSSNGGIGKGMFPYYTCTLTCHNGSVGGQPKLENEVISWNESKHAQSREGTSDSKNSCARCKSPPNFNGNASDSSAITAAAWQGIQCRICHNLHNDTYSGNNLPIAYYNSTTQVYEQVANATVLCEKCHQPGGSHDSKFAGYHQDTLGFTCANCHANTTFNNLTHLFEVKNNSTGVTGCEVCHEPANHTWGYTSLHLDKITCDGCHDKTVSRNATGYAVSSDNSTYGIYKDPVTNNWSSYKLSHGAPATWPLHNISRNINGTYKNCDKCHGTFSVYNGTVKQNTLIAPDISTCAGCHSSYGTSVNSSRHNKTLNAGAPDCTDCHTGYEPGNHTLSGNKGYIVNESNTCRNSGCHEQNVSGFYERHTSSSDCTACHFANTTQKFDKNQSLYTHDHNLTVEHNFYEYNISGMPVRTNNGTGVGMFPYYTCTLTCHKYNATTGVEGKIDEAGKSWFNSSHARSLHMSGDNKMSCAKCKSPANYNLSANQSSLIAQADWQGIQCRVCHNLHDRKFPNNTGPSGFPVAFYNSTSSSRAGYAVYEQVPNTTVLCQNCHYGTSHDSKFAGTHKDSVGFNCTDCHMNSTFNTELHTFEVKNTTSGVTGCEVCHDSASHTFKFTSQHTNKVECVACHDQTVSRNATGYAVSPDNNYGIYKDLTVNEWTTYKVSHGSAATWPLHNITRSVSCDKCHNATSLYNGTVKQNTLIAPDITICTGCHSSYGLAVSPSKHDKSINASAPNCTECHTGYESDYGHANGTSGYVVNESNTCRKGGCHSGIEESHGNISMPGRADCTQCHFANTTRPFSRNASLYTHDHNMTVEYNFYNYNISGIPLSTNNGTGKGMFPYYTCTLTCHNGSGGGRPKLENEVIGWSESAHARSREGTSDSKNSCARCKSPANFNGNASNSSAIAEADWQGIQCRICHNLHNDSYSDPVGGFPLAFYNATATNLTGSAVYDQVPNSTVLCESCHQPGSSHDSKFAGYHKDTAGLTCADCHANTTLNNLTHTFEVKNNATGEEGCEICHTYPGTTHSLIYSYHDNVTCWACHDQTVSRNDSGYVINTTAVAGGPYGIYKDTTTNKWTTYKVSHGSAASWPLHNISRNVICEKCHGAKSVYSGTIATGFGGNATYTAGPLVNGYNLIALSLIPEPAITAKDLMYTSPGGIPGITKIMKWNSTAQAWEGYEYTGVYLGTNFTMDGYKGYFIKGNASTAGKTYIFRGRSVVS